MSQDKLPNKKNDDKGITRNSWSVIEKAKFSAECCSKS